MRSFTESLKTEQEWTKQVPSVTVCSWFYMFFLISLGVAILSIVSFLGVLLSHPKKIFTVSTFTGLAAILFAGGLAVTNTLFYYILCSRSILPNA